MSPENWKERISHILLAIQEIQDFTDGIDFESFDKDEKTIRAVEMNFVIIDESASRIPEEIEKKYSNIPLASHASDAKSNCARLFFCRQSSFVGHHL